MLPRISIITPSFQQAAFLSECLASVRSQDYPELEHIAVDGGSTDGSKEILAADGGLSWWCSEADRGQSHAINKGLQHATGAVFGWLNSDDLLLPGALRKVGEAFASDPELLVHGGLRLMQEADGRRGPLPLDDAADHASLFIDPKINQQSTFFRLDAVRSIGGVEEELHYAMDLELWWQLLFAHGTAHLRFDPVELAVFRMHVDSKTGEGTSGFRAETAAILMGMASRLGLQDWIAVLRIAYPNVPTLRAMPLDEQHRSIVHRMLTAFLLKWHGSIHERTDFEMMRAFRRTITIDPTTLDPRYTERLAALDRQLNVPNWLAFRVKRKLHHLAP